MEHIEQMEQVDEIYIITVDGLKILHIPVVYSLQEIYQTPQRHDLLYQTLTRFSWQFRNETSIERAILSPDLAPEWIAALLALGAQVVFDNQEQSQPLDIYLRRGAPRSGKIWALQVPIDNPGLLWGEAHVSLTPSAAPIVSAVAVVQYEDEHIKQACIVLTGVWRESARLTESANSLVGSRLDAESIQRAAELVESEVAPRGDYLGDETYRRAMSRILTRRALESCKNLAFQRELS